MATTTPTFGWQVPTSTDLVKDGAVAIETLGDSIDTSFSKAALQCVSTTKTDVFTTTSASLTDITGLSVTITPRSTTSKILVLGHVAVGASIDRNITLQLVRGSTNIDISTGGSTNQTFYGYTTNQYDVLPISVLFLDSPASATAVTYKLQLATSGATAYVNRRGDGDTRSTSTITVIELAG
jgi:hypothetical protein